MRIESDAVLARRIGFAIAAASALFVGLRLPHSQEFLWYPLFGWSADFFVAGVLDILKVGLVALLVFRGVTPGTLLLGACSVALIWLASYSAMGAFIPQTFFNLLYFAAIAISIGRKKDDEEQLRIASSLYLAIIFCVAGAQKINSSYLAGEEFLDPFGFMGPFIYFGGTLPVWLSTQTLPWLSIVIEVGIGLGLLCRPRFFAHLAVFFVLILSLQHPAVLFVYYTVAPLLLLIDPRILSNASSPRVRQIITNEYFWLVLVIFWAASTDWGGKSSFVFFLRPWSISIALLFIHAFLFRKSLRDVGVDGPIHVLHANVRHLKWVWLVLLLMVLSPVARWFGAPAPIGFTMFSARAGEKDRHQINIEGKLTCARLQAAVLINRFSDAAFIWEGGEICRITGPTLSGADFVLKKLCRSKWYVPGTLIERKTNTESEWRSFTCASVE